MADNRVIHFEIPADDPDRLTNFYGDLFAWKFQKMEGADYWGCETGEGPGINGAVMKRAAPEQRATNYVSVESVDDGTTKAQELGATVVVPKSAVPGMGWFAVAVDPEGNPFGFWQVDESAA